MADPTSTPSIPHLVPYTENPAKPALNQTYATLPLSFMGPQITSIIKSDANPAVDLADVQDDISTIASKNMKQIQWGWYQQGFDTEPTDGANPASHSGYVTHHNGPQYFGYVADNTAEVLHLHGNEDFFTAVKAQSLPQQGGVFYLRGGYNNNDFLVPVDPNPAVRAAFQGNDDHPGYSDAQISEGLVADEVNAIAMSPYWKDSAIIITYDETDGLYDHGISRIRALDPEGNPLTGGPRIPAIVISPYGKSHVIVDQYSEHSSVIKFIDKLFGLVPLADLPDEANARQIGQQTLGQADLGPADDKVADIGDLTIAFDNARLLGAQPPLPASFAMVPPAQITTLPQYAGLGCKTIGVTPTDYRSRDADRPAARGLQPAPRYHARYPHVRDVDPLRQSRSRPGVARLVSHDEIWECEADVDPLGRDGCRAAWADDGRSGRVPCSTGSSKAKTLDCGVIAVPEDYGKSDVHGTLDDFGSDLCRAVAVAVAGVDAKIVIRSFPDERHGFRGHRGR